MIFTLFKLLLEIYSCTPYFFTAPHNQIKKLNLSVFLFPPPSHNTSILFSTSTCLLSPSSPSSLSSYLFFHLHLIIFFYLYLKKYLQVSIQINGNTITILNVRKKMRTCNTDMEYNFRISQSVYIPHFTIGMLNYIPN